MESGSRVGAMDCREVRAVVSKLWIEKEDLGVEVCSSMDEHEDEGGILEEYFE